MIFQSVFILTLILHETGRTEDPTYNVWQERLNLAGLTTREAFPLMRRLCAEANVIGVDVVEIAPERDPGYTTVHNTNRLVRECLVGIAMRKKGITEEHYLSPVSPTEISQMWTDSSRWASASTTHLADTVT